MIKVLVIGVLLLYANTNILGQKNDCNTANMTDVAYKAFVDKNLNEINEIIDVDLDLALKKIDETLDFCYRKNDYCNRGSLLCYKANISTFKNDYPNAIKALNLAIGIADSCILPAYVKYKIANVEYFIAEQKGEIKRSDSLLMLKIALVKELNDTIMIANAYANRASFLNTQKRYNTSIDMALKAIDQLGAKRFETFLFSFYALLSKIYYSMENYSKAIETCNFAIKNYAKDSLDLNFPTIMNLKGNAQFSLKKYNEALQSFNVALPYAIKIQSAGDQIDAYNGLAMSSVSLNNFTRAEDYYQKAMKIANENEPSARKTKLNISVCDMYIKSNNISKADEYLRLSEADNETDDHLLTNLRVKIFLKSNDSKLYSSYIEYENTIDSLVQNKQTAINLDILEKYQSDKKELENQRLITEQSIKETTIAAQHNYLVGGGLGIVLISLLSMILYRQAQKQKQLTTDITNQKNQIHFLNQELNHRVKNNLAFMTALLGMQSRRTDSAEAKQVLSESENRLKALALVHAQLFQCDKDTDINLKTYLDEIISYLREIFRNEDTRLTIRTELIDYQINAEDAMRLGLIINESVTNSVKHTFTDVTNPQITITTSINASGKLTLNYADNGPGISTDHTDPIVQKSLGLKSIELIKKQLEDSVVMVWGEFNQIVYI